jgi:glycosyltransferase involved in cell wall biosynthesis
VILFLHNRYRTTGGEERAVDDLMWLVRERLGEDAELVARDSALLGRRRAAAGLLRGGLDPDDVARAVRRTRARVVHAHNVHPSLGWRALSAAKEAGARVVLHLHQYRLVCAIGTCFTRGAECTRCHGRNTIPGVLLNCRGSWPEALSYGAALALWQRRITGSVDALIAPSRFAVARLQQLGAPVGAVHVIAPVIREFATQSGPAPDGPALLCARLAPEKGVEVAIAACRAAGVPLVVAGDGPEASRLSELNWGGVSFVGWVGDRELHALRAGASLALAPSLSAESFGLAAAEAMAAGLPVAASRVGALTELLPDEWLSPAGDAPALAARIGQLRGDAAAGGRAIELARALSAPEVVAGALAAVYS